MNQVPFAGAPILCPWAGAKHSGYGSRCGPDGWRQFSVPKSVICPASDAAGVVDSGAKAFVEESVKKSEILGA